MRRRSQEQAYDFGVPFKPAIVPPSLPPESEHRRQRIKSVKSSVLECRCGSREMIETKSGVTLKDGKPCGGIKQMVCAACLIKGQRIVVA